jgi:hypothetical protein
MTATELCRTIADAKAAFQALASDVNGDYYLEEKRVCEKEILRRCRIRMAKLIRAGDALDEQPQ